VWIFNEIQREQFLILWIANSCATTDIHL